jgi:Fe-S-cluster containining protein
MTERVCDGSCCEGCGDVMLAPADLEGAVGAALAGRYGPAPEGSSSVGIINRRKSGACVFLTSGGRCSIFEAQPLACRTHEPSSCRYCGQRTARLAAAAAAQSRS